MTGPVKQQSIDRLNELDDPEQILQLLADATRSVRQEHLDTARILLATAPNEPVAAEGLKIITPHVRDSLVLVATRLAELGALRDGLTVERAIHILWFYFGYQGYLVLIDSGWSFDEAAAWLRDQSSRALLRS